MILIRRIDLRQALVATRFPFYYGIAAMTACPHAFVEAEAEIDGALQRGVAADHLPPKWFTKDAARDPEDEIRDMAEVIRHAAQASLGIRADSVFAFWEELYRRQAAWGNAQGHPPLLYHFGTSLVERALIDAFCRRHRRPFHELLRTDAFSIRLERLHPELGGSLPADWLPRRPADSIICRHTVGLADPLTEGEIPAAEALDDGLPRSLAACIRSYRLIHFKIKINSDRERTLPRLREVAALIEEMTGGEFAATLDGNEGFAGVADFRDFWREAGAIPELAHFFRHLLFVEQPFLRRAALSDEIRSGFLAWRDPPPTIIDESDAEIESLGRAIDCGYAGTSHKNCKGVIHGIASACLLAKRRRAGGPRRWIMSGEDLANIGPVALTQDLAVQAALGNKTVERNGHHFFRGLSFWPEEMQRQTLRHHPDLYRATAAGWPTVEVREGRISTRSVNRAPFGAAAIPALEGFAAL